MCVPTPPYDHPAAFGVIANVDIGLSDQELASHLRADVRLAKTHRLEASAVVDLTLYTATLAEHVLLGHAHQHATKLIDCPTQCRNYCGFGPIKAVRRRPTFCSNCVQCHRFASDGTKNTCISSEKCVNWAIAHSATSSV